MEMLRIELQKAASTKEAAERHVLIAAVISEALRQVHQDPVLVGGAAVEYYTQGGYSTADIDLVAEGGSDLLQVMEALGFERMGKDFIHSKLKIYVEFPSRNLRPGEIAHLLRIGKKNLRIISPEDLIVDRLCAFKFWQSAIDGVNVLLLLEDAELDLARIETRAKEEKVLDALKGLQELQQEIIRMKIPPAKANQLLESRMKKLK